VVVRSYIARARLPHWTTASDYGTDLMNLRSAVSCDESICSLDNQNNNVNSLEKSADK
jgi:hypothetical protein